MARTRAERRLTDWLKARRKQNICKEIYLEENYYNNLHQYSKNKIHCSCPMCSQKTNGRKWYGARRTWTSTDQKRIDEMNYEVKELDNI